MDREQAMLELEAEIRHALRLVMDPEVGINIVDLGLVYGIEQEGDRARIRLTMTSAGCPMHSMITQQAAAAVRVNVPALREVEVELVWEPAWTPAMMAPEARAILGWDS
jgi:metal-sulfur cluster biosynthetic enzyme